jgi:hypothetical protein
MNNFFEGLKNQILTFCIWGDSFIFIFCILIVEKITFKVPACFYEHLLILEILPEAASEFPVMCVIDFLSSLYNNASDESKRMENLNSTFEKADSQSSACDLEK